MPEIIVIGGGSIGSSIAYYLAKAGRDVLVLERGELAGEATGASAGMLAPLSEEGEDRGTEFARLCIDALGPYNDILPELEATGVELHFRRSGVLSVAIGEPAAAELRQHFEARKRIAPRISWLEGDALRTAEPELSTSARAAILSPDDQYLDPKGLTLALAEAARRHGARIETQTPVAGFVRRGASLTGVRTAGGVLEASSVVLAGGPWTAALSARLGVRVPVVPVRGQMLSVRGPATPLKHVIWGHDAYLLPREEGQTFIGASVERVGYRKVTTISTIERLRRAASAIVPGLAPAPEVRRWAGLRPASPDGLPIMGRLPGWDNAWVATGHFRNGILLAPITGQLMASSIVSGRALPDLKPFAVERFLD